MSGEKSVVADLAEDLKKELALSIELAKAVSMLQTKSQLKLTEARQLIDKFGELLKRYMSAEYEKLLATESEMASLLAEARECQDLLNRMKRMIPAANDTSLQTQMGEARQLRDKISGILRRMGTVTKELENSAESIDANLYKAQDAASREAIQQRIYQSQLAALENQIMESSRPEKHGSLMWVTERVDALRGRIGMAMDSLISSVDVKEMRKEFEQLSELALEMEQNDIERRRIYGLLEQAFQEINMNVPLTPGSREDVLCDPLCFRCRNDDDAAFSLVVEGDVWWDKTTELLMQNTWSEESGAYSLGPDEHCQENISDLISAAADLGLNIRVFQGPPEYGDEIGREDTRDVSRVVSGVERAREVKG